MEENKYYIPEIEDIRIGYQCEWRNINEDDTWKPTIISNYEEIYQIIRDISQEFDREYRVPYLTKEDMIGEGWVLNSDLHYEEYIKYTGTYDVEDDLTGIEFKLRYNFKDKSLFIEKGIINYGKGQYPYEGNNYIFAGTCRCINDFKLIMKLLNIK